LGIQVGELNEVIDKQPAEVEIIDRQKIGLRRVLNERYVVIDPEELEG
jgi:hypothetical protein